MEEDRRPGQPKNGIPERAIITTRILKVRKKALSVGTVWSLGWTDTCTYMCAYTYILWKEIIHQTQVPLTVLLLTSWTMGPPYPLGFRTQHKLSHEESRRLARECCKPHMWGVSSLYFSVTHIGL